MIGAIAHFPFSRRVVMAQQQVRVTREFHQPVETIFAALADHENLSKVFGIPVRRVRDGNKGDLNGVGSVRRLGIGPIGVEETVTAVTPNRSIRYKITKGGAPIRNHRGELAFAKTAQGSTVLWTIDFDASVPLAGPILKFVLTQALTMGLKRIG